MPTAKIELEKDEAFAAFAVVSRYVYDGRLEVCSSEEEKAMKSLCEALDHDLLERFRDDYKRFVSRNPRTKTAAPDSAPSLWAHLKQLFKR